MKNQYEKCTTFASVRLKHPAKIAPLNYSKQRSPPGTQLAHYEGSGGYANLGFGGLKGKPGKMGSVLNSYNAAA